MAGLRCLTGTRSFLRGATCLQQAAVVNGGDRELSVKARSAKPKLWTLKDPRPSRERQARPQRQEYLTQRQAAFAREQEKASALGLDWSIRSALVLERLQIVVPEFEDWKRDMFELQARQKFQGVDIPPETGLHNPDAKLKTMEELLAESPIPLAPRRTPADEANDRTSLNRALDARLVLIIKSRPGDPWTLPESAWQPGETIRQAAERTSKRVLVKTTTTVGERGDVTQLHFVGNCPAGWFWRTADEEQLKKKPTHYGEKVFINKAQLIKGNAALVESEVSEYLWVTKHEIGEYLGDSLGAYLKHML